MFTFFLNVGMEGMFLLEVDYNATQHNTTKSSSIKRTILDLLVHVLDSSHNHDAICNTTLEQKMKSIPTEERKKYACTLYPKIISHTCILYILLHYTDNHFTCYISVSG